jgi:hypothetical protein
MGERLASPQLAIEFVSKIAGRAKSQKTSEIDGEFMSSVVMTGVRPEKFVPTLPACSVRTIWGAGPPHDSTGLAARLARKCFPAMKPMKFNRPAAPVAADSSEARAVWSREVYAVAEALRRSGRNRRLRDVTIVLPIDHRAVEAIELACLALAEGELSEAANDLNRFLDGLAQDSFEADRFLSSVRNVARRVGQVAV